MYKLYKFKYARESLVYLIKTFNIEEIYIPYYLCDVIRHSIVQTGAKPIFYHIDDNFMPAQSFPENSFILYPNYFGVFDKNVQQLTKIYPKLIVDNAHSFYSKPSGFACFNSERKFNPENVNSYLWIKKEDTQSGLEPQVEYPRQELRRTSFKNMHERFIRMNLLKLDIENIASPFCYPCLLSEDLEADRIAEELQKEGKIIYRYWNNLPKSYNEYKFYRRLVPIPIDF